MKKIFLILLLISSLYGSEITFFNLTDIYETQLKLRIDRSAKVQDFNIEFDPNILKDDNALRGFYNSILYKNNLFLDKVSEGFYRLKYKETFNNIEDVDDNITLQIPQVFDTHIYRIKNITNEDLETVLSVYGEDFSYKYLPQSNTLVYSCSDALSEQVYTTLSTLDIPTKQAQIKVTIMINDNSLLKEFGSNIQDFGLDLDMQKTFQDFFSKRASSSYDSTAFLRFNTLIRFMQTAGVTAVEQSPTLLLKNGTKSTLKSVKTVPYIESTTSVQDTKESTTESIKYKDIGLQLAITPKIDKDYIFMNISLISEELLDMNDNKPITQKVEYTNSVYLRDKPVLLTGIVKKSNRSTVVGVPLLKDIPILGHFFKYTNKDDSSQTISILIERL